MFVCFVGVGVFLGGCGSLIIDNQIIGFNNNNTGICETYIGLNKINFLYVIETCMEHFKLCGLLFLFNPLLIWGFIMLLYFCLFVVLFFIFCVFFRCVFCFVFVLLCLGVLINFLFIICFY